LICGVSLFRTGDRVVLIDAGLGKYEGEQWHGSQFPDSLRGLGALGRGHGLVVAWQAVVCR
jgi:hypothetical protein